MFILVSPNSSALGRWDSEVCGMNERLCFTAVGRINTLEILENVQDKTHSREGLLFPSFFLFYKGVMAYSAFFFFFF